MFSYRNLTISMFVSGYGHTDDKNTTSVSRPQHLDACAKTRHYLPHCSTLFFLFFPLALSCARARSASRPFSTARCNIRKISYTVDQCIFQCAARRTTDERPDQPARCCCFMRSNISMLIFDDISFASRRGSSFLKITKKKP